jgi:hypothetical protein
LKVKVIDVNEAYFEILKREEEIEEFYEMAEKYGFLAPNKKEDLVFAGD